MTERSPAVPRWSRRPTGRGDVDAPHLAAIAVAPGAEKELAFVAVTPGTSNARCLSTQPSAWSVKLRSAETGAAFPLTLRPPGWEFIVIVKVNYMGDGVSAEAVSENPAESGRL